MASAALGMDWTYRPRQVRGLFPEWDPRGHWIERQDDSNLGR